MASSGFMLFICCSVLQLVALAIAQNDMPLKHICSKNGNFTEKGSYLANLNHLLPSLSAKTNIKYGFYNASYGKNSNKVNAMALCRGDVTLDSCHDCIKNSTLELRKGCPNQKEAVIWYDYCMVRYSNRYFFSNMEFGPYFWMYNVKKASNAETFMRALRTLLNSLKGAAASGGSRRKFAIGITTSSKSQTIYALVQCTPDLSKKQCRDCLTNATALLPKCCYAKLGGRVIAPSCNFRYEIDSFYNK